jgi:hypothetical protein
VIKNLLFTYGLGAGWLWWFLAPMSGATRWIAGAVLVLATIALAVAVRRRSRRLHSDVEGVPGKLVTHVGGGETFWDHDDDEGLESTVGGGW